MTAAAARPRVALAARAAAAAAAASLAGCGNEVDPAWQLDHDRVIAVRATPSRIASGEVSVIDALIGHEGAPPDQPDPDTMSVVSPSTLTGALSRPSPSGHWMVTAPGDDQLAAARAELSLGDGDPVPVRLTMTFPGSGLIGLKVVWLGAHADNPVIDPVMIGDANAVGEAALAVPVGVDVPLAVDFDTSYNINWLTSCGTMHDFDLSHARLHVDPSDPQSGTLAIVVRDALGGVGWQLWPIAAK